MQISGIGPNLIRALAAANPDALLDLLAPGRVVEAEVVSVFQDRAVLSFGRGARLEVRLQSPLKEGQQVLLQVQQPEPERNQYQITLKVMDSGQTTSVPGQSQPASAQPAAFWVPIPLPDGTRGWAQLQVEDEAPKRGRGTQSEPTRRVRLWWETPALGPVQVTLDASSTEHLAAIFTVAGDDSRSAMERSLPQLRERLAEVGFTSSSLGCRRPMPGEPVGPTAAGGGIRLDRRL